MTEVLYVAAVALMGLCAALGWLFVARYSLVPWYASREGRHLMKFTVALSLTFSLSLLFLAVDPKLLTRAVLSCVLFGWIAWELGTRNWLHELALRDERKIHECVAAILAERETPRDATTEQVREARRRILEAEARKSND